MGVLQNFATFSQLTSRREASVIFLKTSRFIAAFCAVTDPAAPAPMMRTLSMEASFQGELRGPIPAPSDNAAGKPVSSKSAP